MLKINQLKGKNDKMTEEERTMIYLKIVASIYKICANLATEKEEVWAGEMTQWLRELDALPEDPIRVLTTQTGKLTTSYNSGSGEFNDHFWPLKVAVPHPHMNKHKHV